MSVKRGSLTMSMIHDYGGNFTSEHISEQDAIAVVRYHQA